MACSNGRSQVKALPRAAEERPADSAWLARLHEQGSWRAASCPRRTTARGAGGAGGRDPGRTPYRGRDPGPNCGEGTVQKMLEEAH